ncbi:MAG TPA: hypothetical protein PLR65_04895 [Anaerolineales bacterium]|nr:hypothetical protein [Anaerolineales bacterium]
MRERKKTFDTSAWYDYVLGFIVAGFLSGVASFLVTMIGSIGFFGWFLIAAGAPTAGVIIAEGVRLITRKRRSRSLFITIAIAVVLGALPIIVLEIFIFDIFGIVFQVIYLVIATPIVYTRLSGIQLFR